MKAIIDKETCIGCTLCEQLCPQVFKMEGDKAVACVEEIPDAGIECSREAADQCPVNAIKVE